MNATQTYRAMLHSIAISNATRLVSDPKSPSARPMKEAIFGTQYRMLEPLDNAVGCVEFDRQWAIANTLHFFASTEKASVLRKYNRHADRFLDGDRWVGAYGAIAVPQLERCIQLLMDHPNTRRAVLSMGGLPEEPTVNLPTCWSFLHFQQCKDALSMHVYQRSLSLKVMPYDCVVLTNVLNYAAAKCGMDVGEVVWTVGNLHVDVCVADTIAVNKPSIVLDVDLLVSPTECYRKLEEGW